MELQSSFVYLVRYGLFNSSDSFNAALNPSSSSISISISFFVSSEELYIVIQVRPKLVCSGYFVIDHDR